MKDLFFFDELILYKPPKQSYNPQLKKIKMEHIQIRTKAAK
jgi:hypothetical protein